ncbi:CHAT domain-containing protein [Actinospica sp.]|uniref:CHAT domain-containing protein n=1 Tax=Actinospica sp. TaxID=1872142 RepID=UPI002C3F86E4|nr:CHAT domain-containing protein [Actinospica sp.]HWG28510.1 CHAT domain-containing protein [Actinospica sp.]
MSQVPVHVVVMQACAGHGDLPAAVDAVRRMETDDAARSALAAELVLALMRSQNIQFDVRSLHALDEMLEIAQRFPPPGPQWPRLCAVATVMALMGTASEPGRVSPAEALARLDAVERDSGSDAAVGAQIELARMMFTFLRGIGEGDQSVYSRMPADFSRLRVLAGDDPRLNALADYLTDAMGMHHKGTTGGDVRPDLVSLQEKAGQIFPADSPVHEQIDSSIRAFEVFGRQDAAPTRDEFARLAEAARRPGISDGERAMRHAAVGGAALSGGTEHDLDRIAAGIGHFREALALTGPEDPRRGYLLASLALGLYRRIELTGDARDLAEAGDVLERAKAAAAGPGDPAWPLINELLSQIRARGGDPDARESALEVLRGITWNVLLQNDPAAARRAAREAASSAVQAARMCLLAGDPADALRALEGGRGLMLFAAGEFREAAARLDAAGHGELAERWRRVVETGEADAAPTNLRTDVLTALAEHSGVLDPPSLSEIRHALRTLDADALIYLVPGGEGYPGYAVTAAVGAPPGYLGLANLTDSADRDVERCIDTLATRDLGPSGGRKAVEDLDRLCDWAWRAAIGPIIENFLPTLPPPASGRVPRVILVPMGRLALVPWQAARRRDGVHAVQLAAFSFAASARLLCRAAAVAPVPAAPVGLVVGDPDTGRPQDRLPAARIEAYAVHQAFYRGGRYLGTRADGTVSRSGPGSADELLGWLDAVRPGAGAVLHLACHGVIEGADQDSALSAYLLLANGDRVTAEQIVRRLSTGPDRGIGLAVLAACRTGRSIHGYDEAYSLGTAFLAGGVRSVLATQWAVPDRATSVLMFMFHHHLTRGLPAWAALREAQLWMLLGDERPVPPGMPKRLREQWDKAGSVGVEAWAGFVHQGQ